MDTVDDLITWLRAQLDTIEAATVAYRDGHAGPCINYEGQDPAEYTEYDSCSRHIAAAEATPYRDATFGLADIAAKRGILDEHNDPMSDGRTLRPGGARTVCGTCHEFGRRYEHQPWPCTTLCLLALPLADRDGYREEWRP